MKACPISVLISGNKARCSSAIVALALFVAVIFNDGAIVSAQQSGQSKGAKIWLADRQPVSSSYANAAGPAMSSSNAVRGTLGGDSTASPAQTLSSGKSTALSLTSADLNGDGINDVAAGYAAPNGGGIVALHYGSLDALAPQSDASFHAISRGDFPSAFLQSARVISVPVAPNFIAA
jgi:hypothetical protein